MQYWPEVDVIAVELAIAGFWRRGREVRAGVSCVCGRAEIRIGACRGGRTCEASGDICSVSGGCGARIR